MSTPDALGVAAVLDSYNVTQEMGLTEEQVLANRAQHGKNELEQEPPTPLWKLVLEQFDDLLVQILLGAAVLSFVLAFFEDNGEEGLQAFVEPAVILTILILNAIVGVWQEANAESALEALKELQPKNARCIRGGVMNAKLPAEDLVPGDIVEIHTGDKIPADLRIVEIFSASMKCEEAAVTGESVPTLKETDAMEPLANGEAHATGDLHNMAFSGTTVSNGKAVCLVTGTGLNTIIGTVHKAVSSVEEEKTPLKIKLDEFGDLLAKVIGLICLLVWVMNYQQFSDPAHGGFVKGCIYYLKIAVALGVAAIPEGLPAVITLCLALGTRKMVKKNCIVRKLPSVETLGCCTVICSDKTGTLTTNEMVVRAMVLVGDDGRLVESKVEGTDYSPVGKNLVENVDALRGPQLDEFVRVAALCNDSIITPHAEHADRWVRIGEPTEAALKVLGQKLGYPGVASLNTQKGKDSALGCRRLATLDFSRSRKSMSVLAVSDAGSSTGRSTRSSQKSTGAVRLYCKGAPESVLGRCTHFLAPDGQPQRITEELRDVINGKVDDLACRPLRTLALAIKNDTGILSDYDGTKRHPGHAEISDMDNFVNVERDMCFVGLVGIKDPARAEVPEAIKQCFTAGVRVIVITGDKKETAEAIAREINVFGANEDISQKSFTGREFMRFSDEKKKRLLKSKVGTPEDDGWHGSRLFSRTDPTDKMEIVNLLKELGEVPAMTGDGVNDAPALKAASIGIAMGISGTEVAKEAADMVLADDNFSTIVSAIEEGRSIYSNMKAFIRYLISSNIGEVASIFLTAALGLPEGLIPVQLLWVNLVTDGPPATALGFNPADPDVMKKPPRGKNDVLINQWVFFRYMVVGLYVGFATVGVFAHWYMFDYEMDGHTTVTFTQLRTWGKCLGPGENATPAATAAWEAVWKPDGKDFTATLGGDDFLGHPLKHPCDYFTHGKVKGSTLSLSVLVTIEMFNALNALSENGSLLQMPPWVNPWLLLAMGVSFAMHFVILYIPALASIFEICPLSCHDWWLVFLYSVPVIFIDEALKLVGRMRSAARLAARAEFQKKHKHA